MICVQYPRSYSTFTYDTPLYGHTQHKKMSKGVKLLPQRKKRDRQIDKNSGRKNHGQSNRQVK